MMMNDLRRIHKKDKTRVENAMETIENAIRNSISRYTNEDIGGGFILGIKAPVIITHGAADKMMFKNSVEIAARLAGNDAFNRSEERRVGKERRERWWRQQKGEE